MAKFKDESPGGRYRSRDREGRDGRSRRYDNRGSNDGYRRHDNKRSNDGYRRRDNERSNHGHRRYDKEGASSGRKMQRDDRPLIPTLHNIDKPMKELNQKSYWRAFVDGLKSYNFQQPTVQSGPALKLLIARFRKESLPSLPLGTFNELILYSVAPELLSTGSLNSKSDTIEESKKELVVELSFADTRTKKQRSNEFYPNAIPETRLAIILGRLRATHYPHDFAQSYWVLVFDESHQLWALYTDSVDSRDVYKPTQGKVRPYKMWEDTAFGANRVQERVVYLGALVNIPFKSDEEMNKVQVRLLDWSTTSSSVMPVLSTSSLDPAVVTSQPSNVKTEISENDTDVEGIKVSAPTAATSQKRARDVDVQDDDTSAPKRLKDLVDRDGTVIELAETSTAAAVIEQTGLDISIDEMSSSTATAIKSEPSIKVVEILDQVASISQIGAESEKTVAIVLSGCDHDDWER